MQLLVPCRCHSCAEGQSTFQIVRQLTDGHPMGSLPWNPGVHSPRSWFTVSREAAQYTGIDEIDHPARDPRTATCTPVELDMNVVIVDAELERWVRVRSSSRARPTRRAQVRVGEGAASVLGRRLAEPDQGERRARRALGATGHVRESPSTIDPDPLRPASSMPGSTPPYCPSGNRSAGTWHPRTAYQFLNATGDRKLRAYR